MAVHLVAFAPDGTRVGEKTLGVAPTCAEVAPYFVPGTQLTSVTLSQHASMWLVATAQTIGAPPNIPAVQYILRQGLCPSDTRWCDILLHTGSLHGTVVFVWTAAAAEKHRRKKHTH